MCGDKGSGPLPTCSSKISGAIERFFFHLGVGIGQRPWIPILLAFLIIGGCAGGLYFFDEETAPENLWVPDNSQAAEDKKWVDEHFPGVLRFNNYIAVADNVLTPEFVQALLKLDKKIKSIEKTGSYSWTSVCTKLGTKCWSEGILEVWNFDEATINGLSQEQILNDINSITTSPAFGTPFKIEKVLGGITRNSGGNIVSAKAALATYTLKGSSTRAEDETEDLHLWNWEADFLEVVEKKQEGISTLYYYAFRSNSDEGGGAILDDLTLLSAGYALVLVFVTIVLGRFNMVQHKIWVSISGILCIGASVLFSYGICSYAGIFYGPLHNVLPFLILGIGVDDTFIIVQALETLDDEQKKDPIHIKMGHVLKRAGVSITVTSLTDVAAFAIGATTILPALRSFCVYCAISIIGIYILQSTVFVAIVSLDHRRFLDGRDACCCCLKHSDNYNPNKCSQTSVIQWIFDKMYIPFLEPTAVKILMLMITAGFLGFNLYGVIHLEQDFDPNWFIPSDSYAADYIEASEKYFPGDGAPVTLYLGEIDYHSKLDVLKKLHMVVDKNEYTNTGSLNSWFYSYVTWLENSADSAVTSVLNAEKYPNTESDFYNTLDMFLNGDGQRFNTDIVFRNNKIWASRAILQHKKLENAKEEIEAMDSLRELTTSTGLPRSELFPYGYFYLQWEGNRVIQEELYRNLGLAFLCVMVVTIVLIAHVWTSLLVCSCIVLVVINVGGLIYWWSLTIDTVTSIIMILAIGLAVDYSAHIGHNFMTQDGSKTERINKTLSVMGPPVFYGGFSTLLAFILLAGSTSYVFRTFFKVFLGVSLYGLFHGLVYLPIMLSLVGPAPYLWVKKSETPRQPSQTAEDSHKRNGLPPAFYSNQRSSPYPGITPISATPASATPMSATPAPGTPEPERSDHPTVPPRKHEPGTAVVQVTHAPMVGTSAPASPPVYTNSDLVERPQNSPRSQNKPPLSQPVAQRPTNSPRGERRTGQGPSERSPQFHQRELPSLPRAQWPTSQPRQERHSPQNSPRRQRRPVSPHRSPPISPRATRRQKVENSYAKHLPEPQQNKPKAKSHLGVSKKDNRGKSRTQRQEGTRNPQVNQTIIVHHFPNTAGPHHPATQRPTAREVLIQGQQVGRVVTTSQPNMMPILHQHPPPGAMYPVQGYPLQQYPQPMGYPPPYMASAPQLQVAPPAVVGYPNPAFVTDWQGVQNPHRRNNHRTFRSPWH